MNFGDLQTEVFRRIEEDPSDPEFWELAEVKQALNDGWEDLARYTRWYKSSVTFALQDEISYYNLLDFLPEEPIAIDRIWDHDTNRWFEFTTVSQLDVATYWRWEAVDQASIEFFLRGSFQLGVFPYPTVGSEAHNSSLIDVHYRGIPFPMGPDDFVIPFPDEFGEVLVDYALYDLKSQEGEDDIAVDHWKQYLEGRNKMTSWVRSRMERGMIRRNRAGHGRHHY